MTNGVLLLITPAKINGFTLQVIEGDGPFFRICYILKINPELVIDAHHRKLKVFVYTVNQPEEIEKMIEMGVDGVFTNYPDRVLQYKEFNK